MGNKKFIVASCKTWHLSGFEKIKVEIEAEWIWASSPEELLAAVDSGSPSYIFFLHWNWYVPEEIWSHFECVCFHMTDLPYGRGGSPLQNLIVAGHQQTQLTALRMVAELDAGPIYAKRPLTLVGRAGDIYRRAGDLSFDIIRWMVANTPLPEAQVGDVVHFKRRKPEQSVLPKEGKLAAIYDHIRMLDAETYPPAFLDYGDFRLEFTRANLDADSVTANVVIRRKKSTDMQVGP